MSENMFKSKWSEDSGSAQCKKCQRGKCNDLQPPTACLSLLCWCQYNLSPWISPSRLVLVLFSSLLLRMPNVYTSWMHNRLCIGLNSLNLSFFACISESNQRSISLYMHFCVFDIQLWVISWSLFWRPDVAENRPWVHCLCAKLLVKKTMSCIHTSLVLGNNISAFWTYRGYSVNRCAFLCYDPMRLKFLLLDFHSKDRMVLNPWTETIPYMQSCQASDWRLVVNKSKVWTPDHVG